MGAKEARANKGLDVQESIAPLRSYKGHRLGGKRVLQARGGEGHTVAGSDLGRP